jgi:hypothetical protein
VNVAEHPTDFFASNLPSIGLIADSSESVQDKLNIERNLRTALLLNSKLNPLVTQENLLDSVGIINGKTILRWGDGCAIGGHHQKKVI